MNECMNVCTYIQHECIQYSVIHVPPAVHHWHAITPLPLPRNLNTARTLPVSGIIERKGPGTLYFPTSIQSGRYSSGSFISILYAWTLNCCRRYYYGDVTDEIRLHNHPFLQLQDYPPVLPLGRRGLETSD